MMHLNRLLQFSITAKFPTYHSILVVYTVYLLCAVLGLRHRRNTELS
jgi:hypothetical protein